MPYNGSGTFTPLPRPQFPVVAGELILADYYNAVISDILSGLTNAITLDGQSTVLANIPMGGFRHTGVGDAILDNQYASLAQLKGRFTDLANGSSPTTGATMVGFKQAGANSEVSTVSTVLRRRFIDADDYISTSKTAAQNVAGWAKLVTDVQALPTRAHVQVSRGTYLFDATIQHPRYTIIAGEGKISTTFSFSNTGDGLQSNSVINGNTAVHVSLRDIGIVCTNVANTGGGYAEVAGTFVELENVLFGGHKYGVIFDQTEVATITKCHFTSGYAVSAGIWLVNGPDHTPGGLKGFTNRITISENHFNSIPAATANIIDDGGGCHTIRDNNFNAGSIGIRAAGVSGLTIQGNESEVHLDCDIYMCDTTLSGTYVEPCSGFDISGNILISSSGGRNIAIQNACNGSIRSNSFGQAIAAVAFINGGSNPSTGVAIEANGKLITTATRTAGAFISGFSRSSRQNIIRQTAVTYIAAASGTGTVTLTPAAMEFITPGTRMRLVNEDGTNGEDCFVSATTATTFTTVLTLAKAANFLFYGATPANEEEGAWTPTLGASITNGTHVYTTQLGRWSRRGNEVFVTGSIVISSKDVALNGNLALKGLPFLPETVGSLDTTATISIFSGITLTAGLTQVSGLIPSATAQINLLGSGSAVGYAALTQAALPGAAVTILFAASYLTSSVI
jgi:hypothetical protein